eukprot:superscaffoldBa00000668_g6451
MSRVEGPTTVFSPAPKPNAVPSKPVAPAIAPTPVALTIAADASGPSPRVRSWLLSSGCPGRKECKSGYTGVVRRTAHHCTASHIVDWQRDSQQTQARYPNVQ